MGTANVTCSLSNLGKFKCYTKSGDKILYEDDGLTKAQSFITFPNKTTLSTGECEYTIGLTEDLKYQLKYQHPRIDWTYTPPSNAVVGTTYSYEMTGEPMPLSNYKGVLVTGIPTKKWTWDIQTRHVINLSCNIHLSAGGEDIQILLKFDDNKYLGNDKLSVEVTVYTVSPSGVLGTVIDSGFFTVTKYSISPLRYYIKTVAEVGKKYVARITRCSPGSGDGYIVKY